MIVFGSGTTLVFASGAAFNETDVLSSSRRVGVLVSKGVREMQLRHEVNCGPKSEVRSVIGYRLEDLKPTESPSPPGAVLVPEKVYVQVVACARLVLSAKTNRQMNEFKTRRKVMRFPCGLLLFQARV